MSDTVALSIVVPCFNEQGVLDRFIEEVMSVFTDEPFENGGGAHGSESLSRRDVELIFVDDGSTDSTLPEIKAISRRQDFHAIRWCSFSRNFGKEAALLAGLKMACGELVVVMDADLQDPPSLLPKMYSMILDGQCDIVATRRVDRRGEPPLRSFFAKRFYRLINRISQTEIVDGARDYRMMTRQVVEAVLDLGERNRFSKGIFSWVGFRTEWLSFPNVDRVAGMTHWSFCSLLLYAIDGIVAFSTAPLSIASGMGIVLCFIAFVAVVFIVVRALLFGDPVSGWPSLACLIVFLGGLQLFCLGILGQYLAKTYIETKQRPQFIVRESSDWKEGDLDR